MLKRVWLVGLCFGLGALLLGPAAALGQNYVIEYSEDFSSDPGWTTDQPGNYFWDSAAGTYHATTLNDHGGQPSPTRYAYTNVGYDGNSMRLEFDIRFDSIDWSAGVMFGLFDQYLNLWPSAIAPEADSIFGSFGRADGGMYITLYVCDSGTGCAIDQVVNVTSDNTWYRCMIEYSAQSQEATLVLRDIATGVVAADLLISGVSGLKPELDYLGFARDPNGNDCCPSCSGYGCSFSATGSIDNVTFSETTGTPCDSFEDGVIDSNMWVTDGRRISWTASDQGSWTWAHDETVFDVGDPDGYLRLSVQGPTSGNTYGAIGWIRTKYDFNDGNDHTANLTWRADVSDFHFQSYHIQVTDGYMPTFDEFSGTPWVLPGFNGTCALLFDDSINPLNGKRFADDSPKFSWSMTMDASGAARLYDGPDATGGLLGECALDPARPWYIRLMVIDATSSGFPAGDSRLNLYDFCSTSIVPPCTASSLLVGDASGNIEHRDLDSGTVLQAINVNNTAIARLDILDVDSDGEMEVLATHLGVADKPTTAFDLASLTVEWQTDQNTALGTGFEHNGSRIWSGDFDQDGTIELVIPYNYGQAGGSLLQIFSGADGTLESSIPQTDNWYPVVFQDPVDSLWKLIAQRAPSGFIHYMRSYDLGNSNNLLWENTAVNTWIRGAIASSMIDAEPRIWGGWYGRTLYVVDRNGNSLWSKSFGGSFEAAAVYAGDLRGDGTEALVIGGAYYNDTLVRIDAVNLADGSTLWTFDDNAYRFAHVIAVEDVNGDNVKEVFIWTAGSTSTGVRPRYQALSGADGTRLWEASYDFNASLILHARFADANGDGNLDVLLAADNSIEARDGLTGALVRTYTFSDNVTAFEIIRGSDVGCGVCGNGVVDPGEECDDGNTVDCDGCRGDCSTIETGCGDGFVCGVEECDDGNNLDFDGCSAVCIRSDFDYECRIVAEPSTQDQSTNLPTGSPTIGMGDTFDVELWASDSSDTNTGIVSGYTDLDYPEDVVTCNGTDSSLLFNLFPGGICDGLIVNELGGSQLDPNVGVEPNWARVALATFTADVIGTASFSLLPATTESSAHGRGIVAPEDIQYGSCSVEIVCPCIYDLDNNCNVGGGDLGLFAPCWNLNDADSDWVTFDCNQKDFDMSGTVSGGDLGWFAGSWNTTCDLIDPIANYPALRQCTPPIVCPLASPASMAAVADFSLQKESAISDDLVILSLRLDGPQRSELRTSRLSDVRLATVRAGERVRAEVWVNDTGATTNGLTVVFDDLDFDPSQFEVVAIEKGETFTLFSNPTAMELEGVVRQVGGATLAYGIAANSWVHVATVELEALTDVRRANISLHPSEGEAVSRYGEGLVPSEQIQVLSRSTVKPDRIRKEHTTR